MQYISSIRKHAFLYTVLLSVLALTGCKKDILQSVPDTTHANLKGNVKSVTLKQYRAEQRNDGKEYAMGELLESKEYSYTQEGLLAGEKTLDEAGTPVEDLHFTYDISGETTTVHSEDGTVTVTRDLNAMTRTKEYRDREGKVIETSLSTIDERGLPLVTEVRTPGGQVTRKTVLERDAFGHVTSDEEYLEGELIHKITSTLNKAGDPVTQVETNATDTIASRAFIYNYDGKGNWTRRIVRHMPKNKDPYYTLSERGITYY